jgi:hypothetical protein
MSRNTVIAVLRVLRIVPFVGCVLIGVETFCTVGPTELGTYIGWHKR